MVTSGEREGRHSIGVEECEIQTLGCKIGYKDAQCNTTQGIQPIFCYNSKRSVTFKNCIKNLKFFSKLPFHFTAAEKLHFTCFRKLFHGICITFFSSLLKMFRESSF